MTRTHLLLALLGLALWGLPSCRSSRRAAPSDSQNPASGSTDPGLRDSSRTPRSETAGQPDTGSKSPANQSSAPSADGPEHAQRLWGNLLGRKDFRQHDLQMDGSWNITYNQNSLASAVSMWVRPGSFVYISLRPALGIEMIRLVLRPDSVWMISRLNKNYWNGSWAELQAALGLALDYPWFEDALLHGHRTLIQTAVRQAVPPPAPGSPNRTTVPLGMGEQNAHMEFHWGQWPAKIHRLHIHGPKGQVLLQYLQTTELAGATLPVEMKFELEIPQHKAVLDMHWKEPRLKTVEFPSVKIPSEYRKIKLTRP